ncbi:7-carboxy-7-deazaguanine synthase [Sphingobium sufflavum]|uniref:7-carboxy-7-deazaguanine synthase n=1 Tax=Sphingobium sufflavum TaxID=1129547 RepID=UPI001F3491C9|nr:7-carboxy-7-deazaguanine synthase [Sphingobium sufflavum]MCE7795506.1 7-carboxy-7-deazaguanine synthase [Sphingobium sufflavum]
MGYAVKEMFLTLQGEGVNSGRRAVFVRFAGCNLWSGREQDRASAVCQFCDTDFVGTDGDGGGRFADGPALTDAVERLWGAGRGDRFVVLTGGEPMLQIDTALLAALHDAGFTVAMESNGTIAAHPAIDWVCISPKAGSQVVQTRGDELKLVWPQAGIDPGDLEGWDFAHRLVQPMDLGSDEPNRGAMAAAMDLVMARPVWRLSLQTHKLLGLR